MPKPILTESKQFKSISNGVYLTAASIISIIGIKYLAPEILTPILLALFITALLMPIVKWFLHKGFGRKSAIGLTGLVLIVGAGAVMYFSGYALVVFQNALSEYRVEIDQLTEQVMEVVPTTTTQININTVSSGLNRLTSFANLPITEILTYFVFVPIVVLFVLIEQETMGKQLRRILGDGNASLERAGRIAQSVSKYTASRAKVNGISAVLVTLLFLLTGIEGAIVWGFLAFLYSFIPYIGLVIASVAPVILAFFQYGLVGAVGVGLAIGMIIFFTENFLEPSITGKSQKLSPLAVFLAVVFWSWLLGPVGTLISVPLTVFAKFVLADYSETRWLAAIMEGDYEQIPSLEEKAIKSRQKTWMQKLQFWR